MNFVEIVEKIKKNNNEQGEIIRIGKGVNFYRFLVKKEKDDEVLTLTMVDVYDDGKTESENFDVVKDETQEEQISKFWIEYSEKVDWKWVITEELLNY